MVLMAFRHTIVHLDADLRLPPQPRDGEVPSIRLPRKRCSRTAVNSRDRNFTLELVTERRIDRAKTLLAFTSEPAVKIGESIGFSEPAHFARRFRQIVGLTPSAYRLQFRLGRQEKRIE